MNILLICNAGMSTSLLVTKMEAAAKEQGLENFKIWAESADAVKGHIDEADVLLLGPQVRYLLGQMKKLGEEKNIPVDAISPIHYGRCDGAAVLQAAMDLVHNKS